MHHGIALIDECWEKLLIINKVRWDDLADLFNYGEVSTAHWLVGFDDYDEISENENLELIWRATLFRLTPDGHEEIHVF